MHQAAGQEMNALHYLAPTEQQILDSNALHSASRHPEAITLQLSTPPGTPCGRDAKDDQQHGLTTAAAANCKQGTGQPLF